MWGLFLSFIRRIECTQIVGIRFAHLPLMDILTSSSALNHVFLLSAMNQVLTNVATTIK